MKLNSDYEVVKRTDYIMLANVENGDLYEINDVVVSILEQCVNYNSPKELAARLYDQYNNASDGFTLTEMAGFIRQLLDRDILIM